MTATLAGVGIEHDEVYLTNAVKHFSWTESGTRRLHKKPRWSEIRACKPWLQAEILAVHPQLIVTLGAVAAQSPLGSQFRITPNRGRAILRGDEWRVLPTYHPSAILRAPDGDQRRRTQEELASDLRLAKKLAAEAPVFRR